MWWRAGGKKKGGVNTEGAGFWEEGTQTLSLAAGEQSNR